MKNLVLRVPLLAAATCVALAAPAQDLVKDGDFESAAPGTYSSTPFDAYWTVTNTLLISSGSVSGAGSRYLSLGSPATVSQTLATTPGASYLLSVDLYGGATGGDLFLDFGGRRLTANYNSRNGGNYFHYSFPVTATSASTPLTLSSGPTLSVDNVSVQPVPEPSALAALAVGALALLGRRRRA